jgi:hypothetical protein
MGQLLQTKRHTATGKQSQALVAAVNRHMPATPASGNQLRIKDAYFATVSISASQSTLATFLIPRSAGDASCNSSTQSSPSRRLSALAMFLAEPGKLAHQDSYLVRILDAQLVAPGRCGGHVAVHGRDKYLTLLACGGVALGSQ